MSEPIPVGLLGFLEALDASSVVLRRDMWRDEYAIRGRRGHIYQDGTGYLLYVTMEERGECDAAMAAFREIANRLR